MKTRHVISLALYCASALAVPVGISLAIYVACLAYQIATTYIK